VKKLIILNKKEGETPLQALNTLKKKKAYKDVKMTYAGRLDPMASGLLLVLLREETKAKDKYLALKKEYSFEVLFGFATDTYDILGLVTDMTNRNVDANILQSLIKKNLKHFKGTYLQTYPPFSSRTVDGKPLFEYARNGESVEIPAREVSVAKLTFLKIRKVKVKKLLENIKTRVNKVNGDFRQEEILKTWKNKLYPEVRTTYFIGTYTISCGSGTYVRSIAHNLGKRIGIPTLAFSIKRTKIGKWKL